MTNDVSKAILAAAIKGLSAEWKSLFFAPTRNWRSPEGYFSYAARLNFPTVSMISIDLKPNISPLVASYKVIVGVYDWSMSSSGMSSVEYVTLESPTVEDITKQMETYLQKYVG